jgi:hypothetical protein
MYAGAGGIGVYDREARTKVLYEHVQHGMPVQSPQPQRFHPVRPPNPTHACAGLRVEGSNPSKLDMWGKGR